MIYKFNYFKSINNFNLQELPPPPPIPLIPELEILKSVETNDYDETSEINRKNKIKSKTKKKNIRKVENEEDRQDDHSQNFSPLGSEEDYSRLYNAGYIDLNAMVAAEQKNNIFDSKMILAITCTIGLLIFIISCVCLLKS